MVPHIARLICSGLNFAMRKHRYMEQGNPLERIKLHLMCSKSALNFPLREVSWPGSHFRALPSLAEGAKTPRGAISGCFEAAKQLFCGFKTDPKWPHAAFSRPPLTCRGRENTARGHFGSSRAHFGAADQLIGGSKMAAGRPIVAKRGAAIGRSV